MSPGATNVERAQDPGNSEQTARGPALWGTILLLACAVLPYAETRTFGHAHDDHVLRGAGSLATDARAGLAELWRADYFGSFDQPRGQSGFWRPWVLLSFRLEALLSGGSLAGYMWLGHVVNVLSHLVATWALLHLLLGLGVGSSAALLSAALFGLHPVHAESVAWIPGRGDSLAAALAWGGTALWLRPSAPRPTGGRLAPLLLLAAAPLAKETGVLLVALSSIAARRAGRGVREALALPAAALGLAVLARALSFGLAAEVDPSGFSGPPEAAMRWFTWLSILPDLVRLCLWPGPATPLHPVTAATGLLAPGVLAGAALLAALVVGAGWACRRGSPASAYAALLLLGTLLSLAPWVPFPMGFAEVAGPLYDRYLYAAAAAVCLPLGRLVAHGRRARPLPTAIAGWALLATLGPVTAARAAAWSDDVALAQAGLAVSPASPALWAHLGAAELELLRADGPEVGAAHGTRALEAFERSLGLDPAQPLAAVNRFITLHVMGREDEALVAARELSLRWPDEPLVLHNLAVWHQSEGRHVDAVRLFTRELAGGRAHPEAAALLQLSQRALDPPPGPEPPASGAPDARARGLQR